MEKSKLVSACGLYCGACHKYTQGKCPGCAANAKAAWCKIRTCTKNLGLSTCNECSAFSDVHECKKFNTVFSKFFYYFLKSDRRASLERIGEIGIQAYAAEMHSQGRQVIKRK